MNVIETIYAHRSIRAYKPDPVPDELLKRNSRGRHSRLIIGQYANLFHHRHPRPGAARTAIRTAHGARYGA